MTRAEGLEARPKLRRAAFREDLKGFAQQRFLKPSHTFVVDRPALGKRGTVFEILRQQQTVLHEGFEADEERLAREGRRGTVGRVARAHGADGQHLPPPLGGAR